MNTTFKSILNTTWKVGLGLFGLAALAIGILIFSVWYEETRGRDYWNDTTLSANVKVEAYNNSTVRVWSKKEARYTTGKLRWVSGTPERDSLTVFCDKDGKRGYLNVNTGEIVIPAQYSKAWQFSEGLGAVLGANNKIGFIDSDNHLVISYEIPYVKGFDYIFKDGSCVVKSWDIDCWRYAVYGKDGYQILTWAYTLIDDPDENGYRVVANEDGAWLYDRYFNKVLPDCYDDVELARGRDGVYVTKNHVKQFLDFDGTVIEPFVIDNTYRLQYMTKYNDEGADEYELVPETIVYQVNDWEGLMDARTGKVLTPAIYWRFEMASKDLIRAMLSYSDESVVMDRRGHIVKQ